MKDKRYGRQTPTTSFILPYEKTHGDEALNLYRQTKREPQPWQELMMYDMLAVNDEDLWTHTKFAYSVPRRNGKNELVTIRELYGLFHDEKGLHTAHRTSTSSSASKRLANLLADMGYEEVARIKKDETYDKHYTYSKQFGLERITLIGHGSVDFRTRTSKGGLGEGFDYMIIDEAQEYTDDQESSLKYVVSDSSNPQIILCGTPPTAVSTGTVFPKLRDDILSKVAKNSAWSEWGVSEMSDVHDVDLWYECNPAMGYQLNERKVGDEITSDDIDFNIQRLGLWIKYNQKSVISENDWNECLLIDKPNFFGKLHIGIKYGADGSNVALSVAVKNDEKIFVEAIDCRPISGGNQWIIDFLTHSDWSEVIIDGAGKQTILEKEMKDFGIKKKPMLPTTKQVIEAFASWQNGIDSRNILHGDQPSVTRVITNTEKRYIGNNGGFGYKCSVQGADIVLLDSMAFAYWSCLNDKPKQKQKVFM